MLDMNGSQFSLWYDDFMTTMTFDTLKFVERLKAAGVPESQAKAEAEAFADVLGMVDVATQRDLKELETNLKRDMAELKVDLLKWMVGLLLGQTALILTLLPKLIQAQ